MTPTNDISPEPHELSPAEFRQIADIARRDYGLNIEVSKQALIQSRLRRRLRALGLPSFGGYLSLVENGDGTERDHFIGALTTNVTRFFREPHHFHQLTSDVMPGLSEKAKRGGSVRLWSAGCSSGQEPYSIAATVLKSISDARKHDIRILATDLDPFVLAQAEKGEYEPDEAEFADNTSPALVFEPGTGGGPIRIKQDVRALVTFARLNLHETWPMKRKFDVIFCRNVVIYFDQPTQSKLWQRFCDALTPGGYLFIGHSERVHGPALEEFNSAGLNCYRKTGTPPGPVQ